MNGTKGLQTINQDGPSGIGQHSSTSCAGLQTAVINQVWVSQQTFVAFMTGEGIEETSVEPVTKAVS